MDVLRTPDERFDGLHRYPWQPHYQTVAGLRMAYVDEGPVDAPVMLLLHGEPTWSYLYRKMIPPLYKAGYRVVAPDLIGFGRSDKPTRIEDYSYQSHMDWLTEWLSALDLRAVTLFCQDWGSLLGLRLAAENPDRFARLVVANGILPTGDRPPNLAFRMWKNFALYSPWFPIDRVVDWGSATKLSEETRRAYRAPYPDRRYIAGARAFPRLVPVHPDDPAAPANREAWAALGKWEKPVLTLFGRHDPILGRYDRILQEHIPGAAGQPHKRLAAGHFIQEDAGGELAAHMIDFVAATSA